jgi:hypothetical protein
VKCGNGDSQALLILIMPALNKVVDDNYAFHAAQYGYRLLRPMDCALSGCGLRLTGLAISEATETEKKTNLQNPR